MQDDEPYALPEDWQPHLNVVRDHISLKCRDSRWPQIAFLYENGEERDAINVTAFALKGRAFAEVEHWARTRLLERAKSRARSTY